MFWKELVGENSATILQRMQRSVISSTLNIARSFKFLLKRILAKVLCFRKEKFIETFMETFIMILPYILS